jgi:hypothetical protein
MNIPTKHRRRDRVLQIFENQEWGNLELLDGWDGEDLEELRTILDEEEYQILLDQLEDLEDRDR